MAACSLCSSLMLCLLTSVASIRQSTKRRAAGQLSVSCDWSGGRRMSGVESHDDYWWHCEGGKLLFVKFWGSSLAEKATSASKGNTSLVEQVANASKSGMVTCDFNGDRKFAGKDGCDDFILGCYSGKFISLTFVGQLRRTTSCGGFGCPAHQLRGLPGIVCNFNQPLRANGADRDTSFWFSCVNGVLKAVRNGDRYLAEQPELMEGQAAQAASQTCNSWATAHGYWRPWSSHNYPYSVDVEYGTTTSDTDTLTNEWAWSLTKSMEAGVEFEGIGASTSISTTFSQRIASSTSSTLTKSYGLTYHFGCPDADGGHLFQWVMKNGRPWESPDRFGTFVASHMMMCLPWRVKSPPRCPPHACYCPNGGAGCDCQTCVSYKGSHGVHYQTPRCNWNGHRRMSGKLNDDDYNFHCKDGLFTGISVTNLNRALNASSGPAPLSAGCGGCDWSGARHFAGADDNSDFYFHCCGASGKIVGIAARNGYDPVMPKGHEWGIPCQWRGRRRASGVNSNDDFEFSCGGGLVDEITAIPDR